MAKAHILLIEDDEEISRLTTLYLESEDYQVSCIYDGADGIEAIKTLSPTLVILDLMLPNVSGIEICKMARQFYNNPILVLTACDDDITEVSLLKIGADDYLMKPLRPHVLVARIESLLRRSQLTAIQTNSPIQIIEHKNQAIYNNQTLQLSDSEFEMLRLLHQHAGEIVSREQCCKVLRGIEYDLSNRSIDMRISSLRKKLGDNTPPYQVITTVRNQGYKLLNE